MATDPGLPRRAFGRTGMTVSALGFGAWAIGGEAYGAVDRDDALRALAVAEELGCDLVDTAAVYGDSEALLGTFLRARRERWFVSTKYSGQPEGLRATLESQLRRLGTDRVEFYMVHWMPARAEQALLDELLAVKREGKARAVGVSLKTTADIDRALAIPGLDGFMLRLSLLDPDPFIARREAIAARGAAVLVRSALAEGFLTGKYAAGATFADARDQRHAWDASRIDRLADHAARFGFAATSAGSPLAAAARYPLSFPEVSSVVLGTRTAAQAAQNFAVDAGTGLDAPTLARIESTQSALGLRQKPAPLWRRLLRRLRG
jgi:aryl-alcohol dehydrogenase-like predicted oxidoreductase